MKKTGMILFILLLMLSLSTGCSNQENSITESNNTTDNNLEQISNKASQSDADMFTDRDYRTAYDENESIGGCNRGKKEAGRKLSDRL